MINIKKLHKSKDVLSINGILTEAFGKGSKDIYRVKNRISRGKPELEPEDARRIQKVLIQYGVHELVSNGESDDAS